MMNKKTGTIWITGLSASGKSTLGQNLFNDLLKRNINNIEFFDGEQVRNKLGNKYGYNNEDRKRLSFYNAKLAIESNNRGNIAIVAAIAHKKDIRKEIRSTIGNFMEIYLKCPAEICAKRDYKGHYKKAFAGEYQNFIGVTEPYEESDSVELILDTASMPIKKCSEILLEAVLDFIYTLDTADILKK